MLFEQPITNKETFKLPVRLSTRFANRNFSSIINILFPNILFPITLTKAKPEKEDPQMNNLDQSFM